MLNSLLNAASTKPSILKASEIETPLGPMIAIADGYALHLLEFFERKELKKKIENLQQRTRSAITPGKSEPLIMIKNELQGYFDGSLKNFKTPTLFHGTSFQIRVWEELKKISFGKMCAYSNIAMLLDKPTAYRAVAQAIGSNQLAIIVPCHRVINANGKFGGYAGGIERKIWLINHELNKYTQTTTRFGILPRSCPEFEPGEAGAETAQLE